MKNFAKSDIYIFFTVKFKEDKILGYYEIHEYTKYTVFAYDLCRIL